MVRNQSNSFSGVLSSTFFSSTNMFCVSFHCLFCFKCAEAVYAAEVVGGFLRCMYSFDVDSHSTNVFAFFLAKSTCKIFFSLTLWFLFNGSGMLCFCCPCLVTICLYVALIHFRSPQFYLIVDSLTTVRQYCIVLSVFLLYRFIVCMAGGIGGLQFWWIACYPS